MIFNPHNIVDYDEVEWVCPHCGFADVASDLASEAKFALVDTTEFKRASTELCLLRKTKDLFDRYPDSLHPCVVDKLHLKTDPQADDEFQRELDEDPELKEFLQPYRGFLLPARLKYCEKKERTKPPENAQRADIACPKCSHYMILAERFYMMIGTHGQPSSNDEKSHGFGDA